MRRAGRGLVVVAAAFAAGAVLATSTRVWVDAEVGDPLPGAGDVAVTGGAAAAVVPALALVALASAGALTIARRRGRVVVLALTVLAGLGVAVAAARVVLDPLAGARASLGEATGLTADSVDGLDVTVAATGWPFAAVGLGLVLVGVGVAGLLGARRWDDAGRFESPTDDVASPRAGEPLDPHDGWDALSRGDDPTRG